MTATRHILEIYSKVVRILVMGLAVLGAVAVLIMMGVTWVDVVMRIFGTALKGSADVARVTGAMAAGCALPYTTAVKGHVAVEFFFQRLGRTGRVLVDTLMRLLGMTLFGWFAWCCARLGHQYQTPLLEVYDTLPIPKAAVLYLLSFCCGVVVLVILHNMLHPGREMIKP
jgi:TRAP-type C4-dicarboxylate transport system permease small subunit